MGVTGFIGKELPALLAYRGARVTGVSRSGKGTVHGVDLWQTPEKLDLSGHSTVINLAGERIDQRWTQENRRKFYESRVEFTRDLVNHLRELPENDRPRLLINGSAVGYYGNREDEILQESSTPGSGYLAELCKEWEDAACEAEKFGVRVITLRTGVVLGKGGPAFQKLTAAFKLRLGGKLGNGQQWMPWIHVEDLRAAIVHAVGSETLAGPVNGVAPTPERNIDFTHKLAAAIHRSAVFSVPAFALKLALGDFASALLEGQHALPVALEKDGFTFQFPSLESALTDLVG